MGTEEANQKALAPARAKAGLNWLRVERRLERLLIYLITIVFSVLFTMPFYWLIISSMKSVSDIYHFPPTWIPPTWHPENYMRAWQAVPFGRWIANTLTITLLALIGQCASASAVAYGFSRFRFPGRDTLFVLVLSTMMLPVYVTLIPSFMLFRIIRWLNTFKPLIVPAYFGGGAFYIFLMRQFFMTIPRDFDEAAVIDGASSLQIFLRIMLPLCKPALITIAIFSFMAHWNDFLGPFIYLNSEKKFTLSIGLRWFQLIPDIGGEPKQHLLMAAAAIVTIPVLLLFLMAQRYFVRGIVMSGIKG